MENFKKGAALIGKFITDADRGIYLPVSDIETFRVVEANAGYVVQADFTNRQGGSDYFWLAPVFETRVEADTALLRLLHALEDGLS